MKNQLLQGLIVVCVLSLVSLMWPDSQAEAQSSPKWAAWVWRQFAGTLELYQDGKLARTVPLDLPFAPPDSIHEVVASPSGRYAGLYNQNYNTKQVVFRVIDLTNGAVLVDHKTEAVWGSGIRLSRYLFDERGGRAVFGNAKPAADGLTGELLVFDLTRPAGSPPALRLTGADAPILREVGPCVPRAEWAAHDQILFALWSDAGAGGVCIEPDGGPILWDTKTGAARAVRLYSGQNKYALTSILRTLSVLPDTGEVLYGGADITLYDPKTSTTRTLYKGEPGMLSLSAFVQGGERILVSSAPEANLGKFYDGPLPTFRLADRAGNVIGAPTQPENLYLGQIRQARDGFFYINQLGSSLNIEYYVTLNGLPETPTVLAAIPDPEADAIVLWVGER